MFGKSKSDNTVTNTIIGDGITVEGTKITGAGSIRIDGRFIGELEIDGNLVIGETGYVKGDIKINHMLIAGKMHGNACCREGIHLASTAELNGNIETSALVIDEGAKFTGSSLMGVTKGNVESSALVFDVDTKFIGSSVTNTYNLGNGERNLLKAIRTETNQETSDEDEIDH